MQVRKQQLELDMNQQIGSKFGKEYVKAVYCHLAYLTYMQSTSYEMLDCMKHKLGSIARRNINNLRYANDTTIMAESEKLVGLKLNIQKTKIMAFGPITSWQIDGGTVETVADFVLRGSKITSDGDCSHEIKRRFLLGRKAMTNLDSILKSKDITLSTKVHQSYGLPSRQVWM